MPRKKTPITVTAKDIHAVGSRHPGPLASPIYWFINWGFRVLYFVNVVEIWKWGSRLLYCRFRSGCSPDEGRAWDAYATDAFIIAKWALLGCLILAQAFSRWWVWIQAYLLFMNLFTYFHYHVWTVAHVSPLLDWDRVRRRVVNAILALGYSTLSFAYFYAGPLRTAMGLGNTSAYRMEAFLFSIANSLTVGYGAVAPTRTLARAVCSVQLVNSFLFGTIIFAASLSSLFGHTADPKNH